MCKFFLNKSLLFVGFSILFFCTATTILNAQVAIGHTSPNANAALDIVSSNSGVLLPRMTQNQRDNIQNVPDGLLLYCTDCQPGKGFYVYDASLPNGTWFKVDIKISTDALLSGKSDFIVPSQNAVKTYVDNHTGLLSSGIRNVHGNTNNMVSIQPGANYNTAIGYSALNNISTGDWNTALGHEAGLLLSTGSENLFIGEASGQNTSNGNRNIAVGVYSLRQNISGSDNIAIGHRAGYKSQKSKNIYIGYYAGYNDNTIAGTQRLYLENSNSNVPLIGGDFLQNKVGINVHIDSLNVAGKATLQVGGNISLLKGSAIEEFSNDILLGDSSTSAVPTEAAVKAYVYSNGFGNHIARQDLILSSNKLIGQFASLELSNSCFKLSTSTNSPTPHHWTMDASGNIGMGYTSFPIGAVGSLNITNGHPGATILPDGISLYAEDVNSSSELKVRDEAGNITTLSPHNFSLSPKSDPMAWSFYSENSIIGQRINIDMLKAIRLIEHMTGEKLVYREDMNKKKLIEEKVPRGYFEELTDQIAELRDLVKQQAKEIELLKQRIEYRE